ncbi:MAG: DNA translocase FtsK [Christensenellales bacterium]
MTYFSGLDKKLQKDNNKPKMPKPKVWAIVLTVVASVGYFGLFVPFLKFLKYFLLGTFGIFSYIMFMLMYFASGKLLKGAKFNLSKKYVAWLCVALVCILSIFHMAFSGGVDLSTYGTYLADIYTMQTSIGGVLLGLVIYPFQKLLGIGAYFVFAILLVICIAMIYNLIADKQTLAKAKENVASQSKPVINPKTEMQQDARVEKTSNLTFNLDAKTLNSAETSVGLDAEIKKEETARDIARRKLGLDRIGEQSVQVTNSNQLDTFNKNYMNAGGSVFYNKSSAPISNGSFGYNMFSGEVSKTQNNSQEQKYQEYLKFMGLTDNRKNQEVFNSTQNPQTDLRQADAFANSKVEQYTYSSNTSSVADSMGRHLSTEQSDKKVFGNFVEETAQNSINIDYKSPSEQSDFLDKLSNDLQNEEVVPNGIKEVEVKPEKNLDEMFNSNLPSQSIELPKGLQSDPYSKINSFDTTNKNPVQTEINKTKESAQSYDNTQYSAPVKIKEYKYNKPPLDLLTCVSTNSSEYGGDVEATGRKIENVLEEFKIPAKIIGITRGPAVTRYELEMPVGISVSKIPALQNDIAMRIATSKKIMIQAPIPGMSAFGIEVPNNVVATVSLKEILSDGRFVNHKSPCAFALGKEINGDIDVCAVNKMPHVLIAGSTGSGKSVCLNSLILSILYKSSPEDVKFILIDPKRVEFSIYQGLPHLVLPDIISEPRKADNALGWAIKEMEKRYVLLEQHRVRNIDEYNNMQEVKDRYLAKMPYIIIIMDEFADMMQSDCKDIENKVSKLAAKARAAGIHLVLATQRPSVDVLSGTAKNNFPARIAFFLTTQTDSRTILGYSGAENLLGRGDMLYVEPGSNGAPKRLQGCYVSDEEVKRVVEYVVANNKADYDESIQEEINKSKEADSVNPDGTFASMTNEEDEEAEMEAYAKDVMKEFIRIGRASASYIQRVKRVGFNKAARIIDYLARKRYISEGDGSSKSRAVYMTKQQYVEIYGETDFDDHD